MTKHSKHIEVNYHFVHDNYAKGIIDIVTIDSEENCADILTKSLGKVKFCKFRQMLNVI